MNCEINAAGRMQLVPMSKMCLCLEHLFLWRQLLHKSSEAHFATNQLGILYEIIYMKEPHLKLSLSAHSSLPGFRSILAPVRQHMAMMLII